MSDPYDLTEEFLVTCSNCGRKKNYPTPLFLNEVVPGHGFKSYFFCNRRCFSIFVDLMRSKWKKSECGEQLGIQEF